MNANDTQPAIAPPTKAERVPDWLRYGAIALVILGIFFRVVNVDRKVYWTDEALTSLRASGHTKTEFVRDVFTGAVVSPDTIQRYQRPETRQGWARTPTALMGNAEHAPLYFVLNPLLDELVWQLCGRCAQSASCVWLACPALRRLVGARTIYIASDHLDGCGAICGDAAACAVCPGGAPLQPVDGVHFGVGGAVAAGCAAQYLY